MTSVFLDTGFAIALASRRDTFHKRAEELAEEIVATQPQLVTTQAVLIEIANALAAPPLRTVAVAFIKRLRQDLTVEIVSTEDLFEESLRLYRERPDKGWGMTDCMSFVVMK